MASKLQKLGKEEIARRIKAKQSKRKKSKLSNMLYKTILIVSLSFNLYYVSKPYHDVILTNIIEIYNKVAPIVENFINQLPF